MNPGIWTAFLWVHHCPFLHTCGVYPHDPQNNWFATTSNDKLGQVENQMALPVVEKVHRGVHFHCCSVPEGVPLLICSPGLVQDTPQARWQALAKMSHSESGKPEIPPKYRVAIRLTTVQKRRCNTWCLATLMRNMLATVYEPPMFLKHSVKCISPQEFAVEYAHPQSAQDRWGEHFPFVSTRVVFHSLVLIPTTSLVSKDFESIWLGLQHPVDLFHLRSK